MIIRVLIKGAAALVFHSSARYKKPIPEQKPACETFRNISIRSAIPTIKKIK